MQCERREAVQGQSQQVHAVAKHSQASKLECQGHAGKSSPGLVPPAAVRNLVSHGCRVITGEPP